ncbi:MAG: sulfotransferase, partial [Acidimicrobiales bacterium]|nr:sulfotransferase [Acidimicrobiales bacterium]
MSWSPPAPADWVNAANRGELAAYQPDAAPFDAAALWGRPDPPAGLQVFCTALEAEADLTPLGRWATQRYLRRLVAQRHRLDELPATENPVREPLFVIGAPRSGTTVTHRLLGADPNHRITEGWELLYPVGDADDEAARIERAAAELTFPQSVAQGLGAIHTYSAHMPKECLSAMAFAFRTEEFISRYHVPSYVDWLRAADMAPAYAMHNRVLETLDPTGKAHWVLKSPVHLQALPQLLAAFPDARFVFTHREPTAILASVSSLIATLRSAFSDVVDPIAIGRYHLDLYARSLDALVDHVDGGLLPADRVAHIRHAE